MKENFKNFVKNHWQILLLQMLTIMAFALFCDNYGDCMIDSFRELYIPQQILQGNALYKDIFIVYPPLAYLINAFILKIFGNVNSLMYLGLFVTLGILAYTDRVATFFLNKLYATSIVLFIISAFILSPNVFNPFLPYSFGILYGILFTLICIDKITHNKHTEAYLYCSLAILCKYEFILLLPLLIFWTKTKNWKQNLLALTLPIALTSIILLIQGTRLEDIKTTFEIICIMSQTKTLHWFYSIMGLEFRIELIPIYIINVIKFILPVFWIKFQEIIIWTMPTILILGFFRYKKLNSLEKFFILA